MRATLFLFSSCAVAVAVACGGGGGGVGPELPPTNASGSASTIVPPVPSGSVAPLPSSSGSVGAPAFVGPMKPISNSTMIADAQAIGIDLKNPPPLNKLEPDKLRKVMKLFKKSLGVECTDCHAEDMAAPTPRKKVAEKMWNEFVVKLTMTDGSPVFCDTCHQGRLLELDHKDKKAVSGFMDDNFVGKMKRRDKKEHECATCHGDPPEFKLVEMWKK